MENMKNKITAKNSLQRSCFPQRRMKLSMNWSPNSIVSSFTWRCPFPCMVKWKYDFMSYPYDSYNKFASVSGR